MKNHMMPVLAALLSGLLLSACEEGAAPAGAQAPALGVAAEVDAGPLDRKLDPAQIARGKTVFEQNCAVCHGAQGKGLSGDWRVRDAQGNSPPPPLDDSAHAWHHPTKVLMKVVRDGSPGGMGNMPAWKDKLSEAQIEDVVVYIKSLWSDPVYRLWMKMEQQSLEP